MFWLLDNYNSFRPHIKSNPFNLLLLIFFKYSFHVFFSLFYVPVKLRFIVNYYSNFICISVHIYIYIYIHLNNIINVPYLSKWLWSNIGPVLYLLNPQEKTSEKHCKYMHKLILLIIIVYLCKGWSITCLNIHP